MKTTRKELFKALKIWKFILNELTPRENRIMNLRYGLNFEKPKTLEEVGQEFGITRERVRQIEMKILKKADDFFDNK